MSITSRGRKQGFSDNIKDQLYREPCAYDFKAQQLRQVKEELRAVLRSKDMID